MLQIWDIHMGEKSQPKPESDVLFKKKSQFRSQKSGFEKNLVLK